MKNNIGATKSDNFLFAIFNLLENQMNDFPTIKALLKISLTLAPGSVTGEQAFSLQNNIKTKNRNCLSTESLSNLMRCSRDGPDIKDFQWEQYLMTFLTSKKRKLQ